MSELFSKEKRVCSFVEPTDEQRRAALAGLSDADLVGRYWRLEDLTTLTSDQRRRLTTYRYETVGYEDYCEELVSHRPRARNDVANLTAVLDRWDSAFYNLRLWHLKHSNDDLERNPIAKVLIYEESRITGLRARLHVGAVTAAPDPATVPVTSPRPRARPGSEASGPRRPTDLDGLNAVTFLAESVANLAAAINRLTDSIARP